MKRMIIVVVIAAVLIGTGGIYLMSKPKNKQVTKEPTTQEETPKVTPVHVTTMYDSYYIPEGVDIVTEATQEDYGAKLQAKYTLEEKANIMKWSTVPSLDYIHGSYYYGERFFDGDYLAKLQVVTQGKQLVHIQFDELAPDNYYMEEYQGISKRFSDYAFQQFKNKRTDYTLVTWVNGITFVEKQMIDENRLSGDFKTLKGSSNTARHGFIPLANEMAESIKQPSDLIYDGYTLEVEPGVYGRLELISKDGKIVDLFYDEIFGEQENIQDASLKPFYRQSKYHSLTYYDINQGQFKQMVDQLKANAIGQSIVELKLDGNAQTVYDKLLEYIK